MNAAIEAPDQVEAPAAPPQNVKVIVSGAKGDAKPKARVEGAETLKAMSGTSTASWMVTRVAAPDDPYARLGLLPVRLAAADLADPIMLSERLGRGSYRFTNAADAKEVYNVDLATQTPPVEFGRAEEVYQEMTPWGPVAHVPSRGRGAVPPGYPPPGYSAPFPNYVPAQTNVAKDVTDALKPFLEMQMKLLEKILDKKDDGHDSKYLLEIEKMKLETAKEERKAREKEAEEARKGREAELKARADLEREIARESAKANAEAAKSNAEAARAQAAAFQSAQAESAKATIEAAKESARAAIEAAKERANGEKGILERYISMQKEMQQSAPEMPDPFEIYERMDKYMKSRGPAAGDNMIAQITQGVTSIFSQFIALRSMGAPAAPASTVTVTQVNPGAPAPAAIPAPASEATTEQQAAHAEATALKREIMDALKGLEQGAKENRDPAQVAAKIKEHLPRVHRWLSRVKVEEVLNDLDAMTKTSVFTDNERATALASRTALAEHLVWLVNVVTLVKA